MTAELSNPHDRFFKEIWSRKAVGRDFLRHYLPTEVVELLDLPSLALAKDFFVDEQLRAHYSDLLYHVRLKDGTPGLVYVLLEHKRTPERLTAFQLLRYLVRIWEHVLAQQPANAELPPIVPVVVYHGASPWPHGQTLQAALRLPAELAPYVPDFRYALCDLTRLAEPEIRGVVLLRVALLVMKYIADAGLAERLPGIFGLLRGLGQKRTVVGYLEKLLRYLATVAYTVTEQDVRRALEEVLPQLEETLMATMAQQWLEQGRTEGRAEGRAEGLQTGEQRVLTRQLELRFGPLPPAYQARIAAVDAETLLLWSERVLSAEQLSDVFDE